MRRPFVLLRLAVGALAHAGSPDPLEARKIEYLLSSIETLQNAEFVRDGTAYDAKAAGAHLRLKRQKAGSKVTTAEDFIRLCASESSMSGPPYEIRFADGHVVTSAGHLRGKLAEFGH